MKDLMQRRTDWGIVRGWCLIVWTVGIIGINVYHGNSWWIIVPLLATLAVAAFMLCLHYRARHMIEEIRRINHGIKRDLYDGTERRRN